MGRSKGRYTNKPYCKLKVYHQPRKGFQQKLIRNLQRHSGISVGPAELIITSKSVNRPPQVKALHTITALRPRVRMRSHFQLARNLDVAPVSPCRFTPTVAITRSRNITRQALLKGNGAAQDDAVQLALALQSASRDCCEDCCRDCFGECCKIVVDIGGEHTRDMSRLAGGPLRRLV